MAIGKNQMIKKILAGLLMMSAITAKANQNTYFYSLKPQGKLTGVIAEGVANRIEFGLLGFREIIGDESKYTFITDHNHKNIFLTPKVPAGEHITLSLVNQAGEIVDLNLSVQKTEGQMIRIDKKISDQEHSKHSQIKEVTSMIRAMQRDRDNKGRYFVTNETRNIPHNIEGLSLIQDRTYKYGELLGSRIVVTNLTKGLKELQQYDFRNLFEGSAAISIQKKVLRPKEKGFVFVIAREKSDD